MTVKSPSTPNKSQASSSSPTVTKINQGQSSNKGLCSCCTSVVIFILVIFGITAVYLRTCYVDDHFHSFHTGDQISLREVENTMSTVLCHAYDIDPWQAANVYLLPHKARIGRMKQRIEYIDDGLLPNNAYNYKGFYLLPRSSLFVDACRVEQGFPFAPSEILLIKGDKNWKSWGDCPSCNKHILKKLKISSSHFCNLNKHKRFRFTVTEPDNYYLVITRQHDRDKGIPAFMKVVVTMFKSVYDVSDAKERCYITDDDCVLNVTYSSNDDVVVEFPPMRQFFGSIAQFTSKCRFRVMFWVGVFAMVPAGFIILLLSCCCCCAMCDNSKTRMRAKQVKVKQMLVDSNLPPSYNSVTTGPAVSVQVE